MINQRAFLVAVCACAVSAVSVVSARWLSAPGGQTPAAGTGRLTGVIVTDSPSPQPVRRATVRIGAATFATQLVGTDDEGRFAFDGLPAGNYTL